MWVFWLILILVLSFIEFSTVNLVSIWFVASAIVSLILSLFDVSFVVQFAVFVLFGVVLMVLTKPFLQRVIKPRDIKTNYDRVIGMEGIVTEEISKNKIGEVKVDGKRWSAISEANILVGESVVINSIEGVKLRVHKRDMEGVN